MNLSNNLVDRTQKLKASSMFSIEKDNLAKEAVDCALLDEE